jgi:ABC-type bacteriocin/lantibiotic exporter with double-glycine peptidase domain
VDDPHLFDQAEDNLDNAFVYDTIVRALQTIKGSRQVIFVTHNPNMPVLGEAERVFVFSSDGQHSTLKQVGTVDECVRWCRCRACGVRIQSSPLPTGKAS